MTEAEQFAMCDAYDGNTMIVFASKAIALRYALHRYETYGETGLMVGVEDNREGTGIYVMWRNRVPPHEVEQRLEQCHWMLEKTLAGDFPMPAPGEVNVSGAGYWRH